MKTVNSGVPTTSAGPTMKPLGSPNSQRSPWPLR